jgi:hypothetical protein
MNRLYHQTQVGLVMIVSLAMALLLVFGFMLVVGFYDIVVALATVMGLAAAVFTVLTVTVTDHELKIEFLLGIVHKNLPLKDLASCRIVLNPYYHYGWGIRLYPGGWMFNVTGHWAVEVKMRDGRLYCIGTDHPDELVTALQNGCKKVQTKNQ